MGADRARLYRKRDAQPDIQPGLRKSAEPVNSTLGIARLQMVAEITQRINEIVKHHIAPWAKSHGFKKHGQRFTRQEGSCIWIVEVKRWKYNIDNHGKVSLDLGVYFPDWDKLVREFPQMQSWEPVPEVPATWCCYVRESLDKLCSEELNDSWWWEVEPTTDLAVLGARLAQSLEAKGLPWLSHKSNFNHAVSELSQEAERLRGMWIEKILCLVGWVQLNNMQKARQLYQLAIIDEPRQQCKTVAVFGSWLEEIGRKGSPNA